MRLGLQQLGENRSFFAADIDRLAKQKPDLHHRLLKKIASLFNKGKLSLLPVTSYPISELSSALKSLSRAAIIGKVAVEMPSNELIAVETANVLALRGDRTYLITSVASGLAYILPCFSSIEEPDNCCLLAGQDQSIPRITQSFPNYNFKAQGSQSARETSVILRQLQPFLSHRPLIAGIIHSAGVLKDAYAHETSSTDFWEVFGPKAIRAWNLHLVTRNRCLECFTISSVSSVLGLIGRFGYAAANWFLDALAHHRQALSLMRLSLNLGVLRPFAGMSRRSEQVARVLGGRQSQILACINLPATLPVLERCILQKAPQKDTQ